MTKTKIKEVNITKNEKFNSKNLLNSITKEFKSEDIYKKRTDIYQGLPKQNTNRIRVGVFVGVFVLIIFYILLPYILEELTKYIKSQNLSQILTNKQIEQKIEIESKRNDFTFLNGFITTHNLSKYSYIDVKIN